MGLLKYSKSSKITKIDYVRKEERMLILKMERAIRTEILCLDLSVWLVSGSFVLLWNPCVDNGSKWDVTEIGFHLGRAAITPLLDKNERPWPSQGRRLRRRLGHSTYCLCCVVEDPRAFKCSIYSARVFQRVYIQIQYLDWTY